MLMLMLMLIIFIYNFPTKLRGGDGGMVVKMPDNFSPFCKKRFAFLSLFELF